MLLMGGVRHFVVRLRPRAQLKPVISTEPKESADKFRIESIHAREILDSRGNPTVEAVVMLSGGAMGRASVPSGASTGKHEAVELRDKTKPYKGLGVMKAVVNVNVAIARKLRGMDARQQASVDEMMVSLDGTPNKRRLGANAILAVSIAVSRAAAHAQRLEYYAYLGKLAQREPRLPIPFCNVINGGRHAGGKLKPQEFMIVPTGARTFAEATEMVVETYQTLKGLLNEQFGASATNVGDEGGFAPPLETPEQALELLVKAIKKAGYERQVQIALDPAASELYNAQQQYDLGLAGILSPEQLVAYWKGLAKRYPIISLEDPFDQDDFLSWHMLHDEVRKENVPCQIVGDDLTVSNPERIRKAVDEKLCNTLLLKVNQIGTLTEAIRAAALARDAGWNVCVSHRSGETEDPFIADLAVALGYGQIKLGAPCRSDRTAKYNQLLRIEEHLGRKAHYAHFELPKV
jgi:enolase